MPFVQDGKNVNGVIFYGIDGVVAPHGEAAPVAREVWRFPSGLRKDGQLLQFFDQSVDVGNRLLFTENLARIIEDIVEIPACAVAQAEFHDAVSR